MSPELKTAITCIALGVSFGIIYPILITNLDAEWRRRRGILFSWKTHMIALVILTALAVGNYAQHRPYLGSFFAALAALFLVASLIFGSKRPSTKAPVVDDRVIEESQSDFEEHEDTPRQ